MNNYMAVIEYDGTDYCGFQIQPERFKTVQGELVNILSVLLKKEVKIGYAGRTDTGVHAKNQVINFKTEKELDLYRFKWSFNNMLPDSIGVKEIKKTDQCFDARRSALKREYKYYVVNGSYQSVFLKKFSILITDNMDIVKMKKASRLFIGERDYRIFSNEKDEEKNTVREVFNFDIKKEEDLIVFKIKANSFLYNMVRLIVGTLIEAGTGKKSIEDIREAFLRNDKKLVGKIVPAKGLFLTDVEYK